MNDLDLINLSSIVVEKKYVQYDEDFNFKIIIRNRSDSDIFNIVIKDSIQEGGVKFLGTGVKIDGLEERGNHPALGINIVKLKSGKDVEVSFNLKCTLKEGGIIKPKAKIFYQYYDYNLDAYKTLEKEILGENIIVNEVSFINSKLAFNCNVKEAEIRETINTSLSLYNSGNISANDVKISIELPKEIKRSNEEIFINEKKFIVDRGLRDIKIGKIDVFEEVNIYFKCEGIECTYNKAKIKGKVTCEGFITPRNNHKYTLDLRDIEINIKEPKILGEIKIEKEAPMVGDKFNLRFFFENRGNLNALNSRLFLKIPPNLKFYENKFKVNDKEVFCEEILKGIDLNILEKDKKVVIETPLKCIENGKSIIEGKLGYEYQVEGENRYKEYKIKSLNLNIEKAEGIIEIIQKKESVVLDEVLEYEVLVKNLGDVELLNVVIKEEKGEFLEFLKGSMSIEGKNFDIGNIESGICIGNIEPLKSKKITFKERVKKVSNVFKIPFKIVGSYQYRNKNLNIKEKNFKEALSQISSRAALFKTFSIEEIICLRYDMPEIKELLDLTSKIFIKEYYPIENIIGNEKQYKLVLNGYVENTIEYIGREANEGSYITINKSIFSTFIILPREFKREDKVTVTGEAKDEYTRIISGRKLNLLTTINLEGRILN